MDTYLKAHKRTAIQDHDGSHIKGLLINFLDHFFPSLLKVPEFLVEFVTPIVRVTKGHQRRDFFTIPEYEQWLEATPDAHKWTSKYYKVSSLFTCLCVLFTEPLPGSRYKQR